MATAFLNLVSQHIYNNYKDRIDSICIVLPNKRAGLFLRQYLAKTFENTTWLPKIIGAEEFFTELSQLKPLEDIDLICHLYESYKICYGEAAESFESFTKWGQLILQDFNEIDSYSADASQLYENLKDIKEIENWSLGADNLTTHQQNYLKFMNSLGAIYKHFNEFLVSRGWAYKGLVYKQALSNIEDTSFTGQFQKIIFCGFNALNTAELKIIQRLYTDKKAELLWDADKYYLENQDQEAGLFLRKNLDLFPGTKSYFIQDSYKEEKKIDIISVSKQIGQAQVIKQKLNGLIDAGVALDKVAVVLANEKLLWPVLLQLPTAVQHVNITMEYPVRYTTTYSLLNTLLDIQVAFSKQKSAQKNIYHKNFVQLLREPMFHSYLQANTISIELQPLIHKVHQRNLTYISPAVLKELLGEHFEFLIPLIQPIVNLKSYCQHILQLLNTLIEYFSTQRKDQHGKLELEYLQIIFIAYNRLIGLIETYSHFKDLTAYKQLFKQVIGYSKAPFLGEPLKGLQIMGLLESRTLDFEHIIVVNVNEGILPAGKSFNSFIPNDLKRAFGLPLYAEKDAIYAYHFYRLIQRGKNVTITYDSETDSFGKGEKSRLVTQLQHELQHYNPKIKIAEYVANQNGSFNETENVIRIEKSELTLKIILEKAMGSEKFLALSPSALIAFKNCSLSFYFRYGVRLKETEEVEENAEVNTFGTILHLSLECFYRPLLNKPLTKTDLQSGLHTVEEVVNKSFISLFDFKELQGKSILQEEVIKVYVKKQIQHDIENIEKLKSNNQYLTLTHLEEEFLTSIPVQHNGQNIDVFVRGKADRIDRFNNRVRVIDYKTSVKSSDKFIFDGFENLFSDVNYNKQLQLFLYAWLLYKNKFCEAELLSPCIIAFKDFKPEPRYILSGRSEVLLFSKKLLEEFELELVRFIGLIFDLKTPFEQTEDTELCTFCHYNRICNRVAQNN